MTGNHRKEHDSPEDRTRVDSEQRQPDTRRAKPTAHSALSNAEEAERNQQQALESGEENTT